jgi:hypothetical protein
MKHRLLLSAVSAPFTDTLYINFPDYVNYGVAWAGVQAWRWTCPLF